MQTMVTKQFEESYNKLNPAQREAVDAIDGPVMVVAGPGTGKTQILTTRIANILLKTDTDPRSILVLTFSEGAALQVRGRLSDMIGTPAYRVEIATFHGFSNNVIRSNPEEFPHLISSDSITEVEQIEILEKIILDNNFKYLKPFGDPLYYLRTALSSISELKKENVKPIDLRTALENQKTDFEKIEDLYHDKGRYAGEMKGKYQDLQKEVAKNEELLFIYTKYQEVLQKELKYDFSDMLLEVVNALEAKQNLLLHLQEKYQYILIDEHQDTNASQNKIVELLCNFYENPNLFVVGDEKQAIYRFQGASLENFLYFQKLYPSAKLIKLTDNYRSHQTILDASMNLIKNNITANILSPEGSRLIAKSDFPAINLQMVEVSDYHLESEFIAEDIKIKKDTGISLNEIVVIARNNKDLLPIAETLERHSIPFAISSDNNIFEDRSIQKLLLLLQTINNFGDDILLLKSLHINLFEVEPLDIYSLQRKSTRDKQKIAKLLEDLLNDKDIGIELENRGNIISFYRKLKDWWKDSHNTNLEKLFVTILKGSGLQAEVLKSNKRYETLDKLIGLFEEIKMLCSKDQSFNLEKFINYLSLLQKHNLSLKAEVKSTGGKRVHLMTAHRSKGQEFDYVYITQCFDGHWGNGRNRNRGFKLPWVYLSNKLALEEVIDPEEDERRLFFVAMTRARKMITFTFSKLSLEGKEQLPSQFLQEIDVALLDKVETNDLEKKFLGAKEVIFEIPKTDVPREQELEFVRSLFLERGISNTGFNDFLICPWRFFYKDLLSLPETRSAGMSYGIAVHHVLDKYIESLQKKSLSLPQLKKIFEDCLEQEGLSEIDLVVYLQRGITVLEKLFETVLPNWKEKEIDSEVQIRGINLTDKINLNGRFDMLEQAEDRDNFIVHDFKTGKSKSRKMIDGSSISSKTNYLQQLIFYKILLDNYRGGGKKMISGVIDFVEPDEKGNFKSETFDITDEQVAELKKQIISVGDQVWNLSFWDTRCGDKDCEYCKLRELSEPSS